tara:strand:+ start:14068 stop:17409 length:3342 start_codon:yes stop_codon:yes gene_type:complete
MVTENVDIRFRETGARVIKRKIEEIGVAANSATRGIFLMQRALFVLGGAGILRALTQQLDTLTNYENRLRLTASSAANLEEVQKRLFQVARDSRTGFEAVADIYSRTALSVRELGVSQAETLRFTESLSKATIISGASSREAHAALIQLGQGMASNTLRGDELRSVLEQLPFVADVIAKSLGVTRGELRELGADGAISAETVLKAFREAEVEIDQLFSNTVPTISQALSVANTNWLQFLDSLDDATNGSAKLAKAIIVLSENIGLILGTIATLAVALAAVFVGKAVSAVANYISGLRGAALAATRLLEIENLRAATSVRNNTIAVASNAQRQAELAQRLTLLGIQKAELQQTVLDTQFTVANGRARNIATGQFIGLATAKANLSRVTQQLSIVENVELVTARRLTGARLAQTTATTSTAAASVRLTAAQAAQATTTARLTALFPTLAGAIGRAGASLGSLAAFIGPLGLIAIAVGGIITAFVLWGNQIKVTSDGVVGLKDFVVAAFQIMNEKVSELAGSLLIYIQPAIQFISNSFSQLLTVVSTVFQSIVSIARTVIDGIASLFIGLINGTIRAWDLLPAAISDVMNIARNGFLTIVENMINAVIIIIPKIPEMFASAFRSVVTFAFDAVTFIVDSFRALPGAIAGLAERAAAFLKNAFFKAINAIAERLSALPGISISAFGAIEEAAGDIDFSLPDLPSFDGFVKEGLLSLDNFRGEVTGAASKVGSIYAEEFGSAFERSITGEVGQGIIDASKGITDRARENIATTSQAALDAQAVIDNEPTRTAPVGGGGGGGKKGAAGKTQANFASIIAGMNQEIDLLRLSNKERRIQEGILEIEKELKRGLTETEKSLAAATLESVRAAETQSQVLQDIIGPREEIAEQQNALNALFDQGRIGIEDYTTAIREMQVAAGEASGTLSGGFASAIQGAIMSAGELGSALGSVVVGAADSAADAIVEFAKTGKLNIKEFFFDLFAQITKLIAKQLILKALGGLFGGFAGGGSIGPSSGLGFAGGGSINPTGPGSTDSQIVQFAKRPDERVDILTPGQQQAQRNNMNGGGGGTTVVQSPPVNVAAVLSPSDIVGAFDNPEGETVVINILQRNASSLRQLVGS